MTVRNSETKSRQQDGEGGRSDRGLRFAFDSSPVGLVLLDSELRIIEANRAAADLLGVPEEELPGMDILGPRWKLFREDGAQIPKEERPCSVVLRSGEAIRGLLVRLQSPGREGSLWIELCVVPNPAGPGDGRARLLLSFTNVSGSKGNRDRIARKIRTLNAIKDFSMRLEDAPLDRMYSLIADESRSIFGAGTAALAVYDDSKKALVLQAVSWSAELERSTLRYIRDKVVKGLAAPVADEECRAMLAMKVGVFSNLHELSFGKVPAQVSEAIEKMLGIGWFRGLALAAHGELFGGLSLAGEKEQESPEPDELLVFAEMTSNAMMRKRAEEREKSLLAEKELLLREVHHRIKNNMSTMTSLLSIQAAAVEEPAAKEALKDAAGRFQSMNSLYDKLYLAEDLRETSLNNYLPALAGEIVGNFPNGDRVAVEAEVQDIKLGAKKLSSLGIIANEIIANSMKYAFAGREAGRIIISARARGDRVTLEIGDDGVGIPESLRIEGSSGFGFGLIRILAKQIDASVSIERRKGTRFVIEFDR